MSVPGRPWEPPIVTTLRRFVRRGAPASLLHRIAGGPRDWRDLNGRWNLDGRTLVVRGAAPVLDDVPSEALLSMSASERRLALLQVADECAEAGVPIPVMKALADHFGVSRDTIANDFRALSRDGKLAWHLAREGDCGVRRFAVSA